MTTQFKSKAEVKAEQNVSQDNRSQDNRSQDDAQNLSIVDGVEKFYESRCEFYENVFLQADQQAAKDVMGKFLTYDRSNREAVGGTFFGNLSTKRQALNFGLLPSLFLPEAVDPLLKEMKDRNNFLIAKEKSRALTPDEIDELSALQVKLRALGELE